MDLAWLGWAWLGWTGYGLDFTGMGWLELDDVNIFKNNSLLVHEDCAIENIDMI